MVKDHISSAILYLELFKEVIWVIYLPTYQLELALLYEHVDDSTAVMYVMYSGDVLNLKKSARAYANTSICLQLPVDP